MPIERSYDDHSKMLIMIEDAQSAERDQRDKVKEAKRFHTERDGQWQEYARNKRRDRFRGTFDMCTPIIDGIAGEIDQADFTIRVSPTSDRASKDTAKTLDGLIRNIRNISNAEDIFNKVARSNIVGGFDAFEIVQDYLETDSFDQDLLFKKIANAVDSVWFDQGSIEQDRSDANWVIKLVTITKSDYDIRWPDGGGVSIGNDNKTENTDDKNTNDVVTVGQLYYKKLDKIDIVQMTDGSVYKVDDDFEQIKDELANPIDGSQPVTIELDKNGNEKIRTRKSFRVHSHMLDGEDWLSEEKETVFDFLPICAIYGSYDIVDNSYVYYGKIENLYDQQRGLNYAMSRDIEDGALGISEKIVMTTEQGDAQDYTELNSERDPIFEYNHQPNVPPPTKMLGHQPSAALQTTVSNMKEMINASSNTFQAQQGNAVSTQSGVAGFQQIEQANIGSIKWFKALEITLCYAGKVIINAAPRVYDGTRQVRILEEDGTSSIVTLNQPILDRDTNKNIILNDLSIGEYDAVCEVGPAFNSSQRESARSIEVILATNPELGPMLFDVLFKAKKEPGMDIVAERFREQAFNAGTIPESQWTDEEKQKVAEAESQAAQQPPEDTPEIITARANEGLAAAEQQNAQTKQQEAQFNAQVKSAEVQLDTDKVALEREKLNFDIQKFKVGQDDKFNVDAANIDQGQQKIDLDAQKQSFDQSMEFQKSQIALQQAQLDKLTKEVQAWKTIKEASGADAFIDPVVPVAFHEQGERVIETQSELNGSEPIDNNDINS